jgi:hypothetical protein
MRNLFPFGLYGCDPPVSGKICNRRHFIYYKRFEINLFKNKKRNLHTRK